ncbi:MAG: hypothetical protein U9N81_10465 [Bacillota bacterium]|nr:hypothetical protein [Bacillota bacterium]
MNKRRLIYIYIFLITIVFVYVYQESKSDILVDPFIDKQSIVEDFIDLSDNTIPSGILGGTFYATEIYFPEKFSGIKGDSFYVALEDGHVMITAHYNIVAANGDDAKEPLLYEIKDSWDNFRPPAGKFESYNYLDETWKRP